MSPERSAGPARRFPGRTERAPAAAKNPTDRNRSMGSMSISVVCGGSFTKSLEQAQQSQLMLRFPRVARSLPECMHMQFIDGMHLAPEVARGRHRRQPGVKLPYPPCPDWTRKGAEQRCMVRLNPVWTAVGTGRVGMPDVLTLTVDWRFHCG